MFYHWNQMLQKNLVWFIPKAWNRIWVNEYIKIQIKMNIKPQNSWQ